MSAVRKEEIVIPMRPADPDEPRMPLEEELFKPPFWGKHTHSQEDLQGIWSRIWRAFKSRRLCEGFLHYNKCYSLEVWCSAFEYVRRSKDELENINYVRTIADNYVVNGTPSQLDEERMKEVEARAIAAAQLANATAARSSTPEDDPDIVAFAKRGRPTPTVDLANNPVAQRIKNRNRG